METAVTAAPSNTGNVEGDAKRRTRRPKSGNSTLFNEILSAANELSVAERTRLVKSLAGQLGLLTVGGQTLLDKTSSEASGAKPKKGNRSEERPPVRANPLKNTKFWVDKEAAKAAMLKAREDAGGAQLPPNHPAVTAYASALKAYKDEQAKLKPVEGVNAPPLGRTSAKQTGPKKRQASKSPERSSSGIVTRARSAAKLFMGGSKSGASEDAIMTDH